jgi:hypothetical protein
MASGSTEHWFVVFDDYQPSLQTASFTRRGAIKHWLEATQHEHDWKFWYRNGMRVRRVKIKWSVQP